MSQEDLRAELEAGISRIRVTVDRHLLDLAREEAKRRGMIFSRLVEVCIRRYFGDEICYKALKAQMHVESRAEKLISAIAAERARDWVM